MEENRNHPTLKIGELAKRFGLNVRTLRYYEGLGLLRAARRESGYRVYSEADAERLAFVLRAKRVGFSLEEIQEIFRLGRHGKACGYVRETLSKNLRTVDARIAELQKLRTELAATSAAWQQGPDAEANGTICGLIAGWSESSLTTNQQENTTMATGKRQVEVFTAGCPLCDPVVKLVQRIACENCDVTVYNLNDDPQAAGRAKALGIVRVPMVLVDGKPAECCTSSDAVTEEGLRAAGVGAG